MPTPKHLLRAVCALLLIHGTQAAALPSSEGPENVSDTFVKKIDLVAVEQLLYGNTPSLEAASQVFRHVLRPYYLAGGEDQRRAILQRLQFACAEDLIDPTGAAAGASLDFPFRLYGANADSVLWHRRSCSFTIRYTDTAGRVIDFSSPGYRLNQLDIAYADVRVEPAVAFQNYDVGGEGRPSYAWMGRYVQPLELMLRDRQDAMPAKALAGVNGGYDYRVDSWSNNEFHDNICTPRYLRLGDVHEFYHHPAPEQCPMGDNALPSCAVDGRLPIQDDLGDSLVYLAPEQRAKSWRGSLFQSYNCGGVQQRAARGAMTFFETDAHAKRTPPSKGELADLAHRGRLPYAALGAGPLLVQDRHFVYDQEESEEQLPVDNYEVASVTGIGYLQDADSGRGLLRLVTFDGDDNSEGLHDWLLGLYFMSPYAQVDSATALGNGGDATMWINPGAAAVQAVLQNPAAPNHAYFQGLFVNASHPGLVSNCDGFTAPPVQCRARPVHDGVFVYQP